MAIAPEKVDPASVTGLNRQGLPLASERGGASDLIPALTELALRLQRSRTLPELMRVTCEGLAAAGIICVMNRLDEDDMLSVLDYGSDPQSAPSFDALVHRAFENPLKVRIPMAHLRNAREAIKTGRSFFEDDVPGAAEGAFAHAPPEVRRLINDAYRKSGAVRGVLSPIIFDGRPWGLMTCAGPRLSDDAVEGLALFAAQLSGTMEIVLGRARLSARERELAWLRTLSEASHHTPTERLADEVLWVTLEATASEVVSLHPLEGPTDPLRVKLQGTVLELRGLALLDRAARFCVSAGLLARALCVDDGPPELAALQALGASSVVVFKLSGDELPPSALVLLRRGSGEFTSEELHWCVTVSQQVTIQLQNLRLREETEARLKDSALVNALAKLANQSLEVDRVLSVGMVHLARMLDVECVRVLLDPTGSGERVQIRASSKPGDPALGEVLAIRENSLHGLALRERRIVISHDMRTDPRADVIYRERSEAKQLAVIPLFDREHALGFVVALENRPGRILNEATVRRAEAVAHPLTTALVNARLYEAERRRSEELGHFLEVSRVISASLELDAIFSASLPHLARVVQASLAIVVLVNPDGETCRVTAVSDPSQWDRYGSVRFRLSDKRITGLAVRERRAVQMPNVSASDEIDQGFASTFPNKSLLGIPLFVRDEPIGAVVFTDTHGPRTWSDDEVERATLMSRQLGVAVANARLYEELRESYNELARTQETLVKRERLAALGELSAVMAHEVRNPLGVIFNALGSLQRILKPEGDAALLFGMLGEEADRLNRIVGDLLDFARPKDPDFRLESVDELVSGALETIRRLDGACAEQVKVELSIEPSLARIVVDARMMRQALVNLILNACQAMGKAGGTLTLAAWTRRIPGRETLAIAVRDTGPGLSPALAARIFEPFFTTKASGTGLGLPVVKHIVDAHKGTIEIEHRAPSGVGFVLHLPMQQSG